MNTGQLFRVAPYSVIVWLWTVTYVIGFIFFGSQTADAIVSGYVPDSLNFFMTLILFGILLYAWLRSIKSYLLTDTELVMSRGGPGKLHIPVSEIVGAQASPDIGTFFNIGVLSIGGVLGWAGKSRVRKPSDLKSTDADVYGTNPKYSVVLDLKSGRKLIVTPANPEGFASALQKLGAVAPVDIVNPRPTPRTGKSSSSNKAKPWLQGNKK